MKKKRRFLMDVIGDLEDRYSERHQDTSKNLAYRTVYMLLHGLVTGTFMFLSLTIVLILWPLSYYFFVQLMIVINTWYFIIPCIFLFAMLHLYVYDFMTKEDE